MRSAQEGLRRSESNFRSLVTNAPYGILRTTSSGIMRDANPALVNMLGYKHAGEVSGINLANLHPDVQEWFTLADQLRSGKKFNGIVVDWLCQK